MAWKYTPRPFRRPENASRCTGVVFSRDLIMDSIWGYNYAGETRTVDVHIRSLRAKLGAAGNGIETVRGVGYRFGDAK